MDFCQNVGLRFNHVGPKFPIMTAVQTSLVSGVEWGNSVTVWRGTVKACLNLTATNRDAASLMYLGPHFNVTVSLSILIIIAIPEDAEKYFIAFFSLDH